MPRSPADPEPDRDPFLIAVMGTTASGKTALAEGLAERIGGQLVNSDAFQIYRGMDIGTAKTSEPERYRLIDLLEPSEAFGVGEWVRLAHQVLEEMWAQRRHVVLVGGTGLYIRALFEGYDEMRPSPDPQLRTALMDRESREGLAPLVEELRRIAPESAARTDLRNPVRVRRALERALSPADPIVYRIPSFRKRKFALELPHETIRSRIARRTDEMVQNGWAQEVRRLRDRGYGPCDPGFRAHGYRAMYRHIQGEIALEEVVASTVSETVRYAKRQRTWLRSEPDLRFVPAHGSGYGDLGPLEHVFVALGVGQDG
jgi:tRNA dimethylallyltransferase